jgi:putative ATP-dependent endonuclease of OLD family
MRINSIRIHNYKSIRDLEIKCQNIMFLIGPNNHGKSNILSSLEYFFNPGVKVTDSEVFAFCGEDDKTVWVEIEFKDLSDQEKTTFSKYLQHDQSICVRKTTTCDPGKFTVQYQGWISEAAEDWLKESNSGSLASREAVDQTALKQYVPETGRITKAIIEEAQKQYISDNSDNLNFSRTLEIGNFLGQKNIGGGVLPDIYVVPAVRDLSEETKIKNTTLLGRLINKAIEVATVSDERFISIQEDLKRQIEILNEKDDQGKPTLEQFKALKAGIESELESWDVKVDIEINSLPIEKIIELGTRLYVDDGVRTLAEQKGNGLQRALIFALLKTWAKLLRKDINEDMSETRSRISSDSVYFVIEEPELYLHPQSQREFSSALTELAASINCQVFLSTHSSHFVDMNYYKSICLVSKPDPSTGTIVKQPSSDLFVSADHVDVKNRFNMSYWINPDRSELFFGRKVIFVEGATEKTIIPFLANKLNIFDYQVSIIDCGSKHNLMLYIQIAQCFNLEYLVVHDEDPLVDPIPEDWPDEKIKSKKDTFELNGTILSAVGDSDKIVVLRPNFEAAVGISRRQSEKKGKPLAALDYFESLSEEELPQVIKELVVKAYS